MAMSDPGIHPRSKSGVPARGTGARAGSRLAFANSNPGSMPRHPDASRTTTKVELGREIKELTRRRRNIERAIVYFERLETTLHASGETPESNGSGRSGVFLLDIAPGGTSLDGVLLPGPSGAKSHAASQSGVVSIPNGSTTPYDCDRQRQSLADYVERIQALAVASELLLDGFDKDREGDWSDRWYQMERARISCEIAL